MNGWLITLNVNIDRQVLSSESSPFVTLPYKKVSFAFEAYHHSVFMLALKLFRKTLGILNKPQNL